MDTPKPRPRRVIRRRPARSASASAASPRGRAASHAAPAPDAPETPQPEPLAFETLGFAPVLLDGIRDRGFTHTTPIQTAVLPLVRGTGDLIACAETGTGKTAAFVLPLLDRLLSSPGRRRHRPHAHPHADADPRARRRRSTTTSRASRYHAGISSMAVYGGVPMEPQSRALTAGVPLVVATPGRLMDHMRSGTAAFDDLEVLVLDEADRMLDMGFWPDVRRIVEDAAGARARRCSSRRRCRTRS